MKKRYCILVTALSCAVLLYAATVNGYLDFALRSAPSNPATGAGRVYIDSGTNLLTCVLHGGGSCMPTSSGGGAWVFLEGHTASASTELDFTTCISSSYDDYAISLVDLLPATNAVHLILQVSSNGGSSWDTTSNYSWAAFRFTNAAQATAGGTSSSININGGSTTVNSAAGAVSSSIRLFNPAAASPTGKQFSGQSIAFDSQGYASVWYGNYGGSAINAFRVLADSGNLASGTVRCYGISH